MDFGSGGPRFRMLASNGVTVEATLYLPACALGGITQSFDENKQADEMLDGTFDVTIKGYYHRYSVKWDIYDETQTGRTVGITNNNTPTADQLMQIFTSYRPGRLEFSPSDTAGWFSIFFDRLPKILPIADTATAFDFEVKTLAMYPTKDGSAAKMKV